MSRRKSIQSHEFHCEGLPKFNRRPLRVPRTFNYLTFRSRYFEVAAWMVQKVTKRTSVVGPNIRFEATGRYHAVENGTISKFLKNLGNCRYPQHRIGVCSLSTSGGWIDSRGNDHVAGHRMVVLCDARGTRIKLYVIDPNGRPHVDTRKKGRKALEKEFGENTEISFIAIPSMNVSTTRYPLHAVWDRYHGIEKNKEPNGYCVHLSVALIMDILCTGSQALAEGHFDRLARDMTGGPRGDPQLDAYNRLMAARSFTYEILKKMSDAKAWNTYVTNRTVAYNPETFDPRDVLPKLPSQPPPPA